MSEKFIFSLFFAFSFSLFNHCFGTEDMVGYKAGVAKVVITPENPMWMAGYGSRTRTSENKIHDLWAKALVMEDENGNRVVLITTDLLGFPKNSSHRIRSRLNKKFNLTNSQIILNSSHTHSGPVLQDALTDIYPIDDHHKETIKKYTLMLEEKIVLLVGEAMNSMTPVRIYAGNGVARFQVNRRNNNESLLDQQKELKGPNDYAVPVIKVVSGTGELMAVAFGYACHPTVLSGYEWSGDYAGFAQIELEKMYPGVPALFFQGAGGDQNPLPRRSVALAKQYGKSLAAAVERVLSEDMRQLSPVISTAYSEVELSLTTPPTKEELSDIARRFESSHWMNRWAKRLLEEREQGIPWETSYSYPLQLWKLGDQMIFSLGGELVIEYAIRLKEVFGKDIFVLGYSNDVMAYIPSARILLEGGYEGESSQRVYGLPGPWTSDIETKILNGLIELAGQKVNSKPSDLGIILD